jgi:hypothetical protein
VVAGVLLDRGAAVNQAKVRVVVQWWCVAGWVLLLLLLLSVLGNAVQCEVWVVTVRV